MGEAALLAGLVKAPSRLSPVDHPEAAGDRMRVVLSAMAEAKIITDDKRGTADPALSRDRDVVVATGSYFVDWVESELNNTDPGSTVRTTLDPALQRWAVAALNRPRKCGSGTRRDAARWASGHDDGWSKL